jgi:hypothetical protein
MVHAKICDNKLKMELLGLSRHVVSGVWDSSNLVACFLAGHRFIVHNEL